MKYILAKNEMTVMVTCKGVKSEFCVCRLFWNYRKATLSSHIFARETSKTKAEPLCAFYSILLRFRWNNKDITELSRVIFLSCGK